MKKLGILLSVLLLVLGISVSAEADPLPPPPMEDQGDTFYDAVSNISWVKNASLSGPMSWDAANTWAAGLTINNLTGWRQPTITELQNLYDQGVTLYTPFPFTGLRSEDYWSGTEYKFSPDSALPFNFSYGPQYYNDKNSTLYALAVRPGRITPATPVPASGTAGLIALTLAGLMIYGWRSNMKKA